MKKIGLEPYYKKLKKDARLKSIMFASMIGFSLMTVLSVVFYFISYQGLLISLITGCITIVILSFIFNTYIFKISIKDVAIKLDHLGLNERVVTMIEHHDVDTIITQKQRESTQDKLLHITPNHIAFKHFIRLSFILIVMMSLSILTLTLTTLAVLEDEVVPVIPDVVLTDEEALIASLIKELREIVREAVVSDALKIELNTLIDALEQRIKQDSTTLLKVARIEETRRIMLERITFEMMSITTIIDELILKDSTNLLGVALKTENKRQITQTIDALIEDFLMLSMSDMQQFVDTFESDIEESIDNADIKNQELENDLRALVELLKSLIPDNEGDEPEDVSDEVTDLIESILESIQALTPEEVLEETLDQTIQEVIDELLDIEPEEPEEPEEIEEPGDDEPWDPLDQNDELGEGSSNNNLYIIDGLTTYDSARYEAMLESLLLLFETNQITDEALIKIINDYMQSIKIN